MAEVVDTDISNLPEGLRFLVRRCVDILGQEIETVYGAKVFEQTESFRSTFKKMRGMSPEQKRQPLIEAVEDFEGLKAKPMMQITHSFALMMELINRCEKAYRSHRLGQRSHEKFASAGEIVYVFTAHPTEARSANVIQLLNRVEDLCLLWLSEKDNFSQLKESELRQTIALLLRVSLSKTKSPTVKDEASWLYDIILHRQVIDELITLNLKGTHVRFRSWVGGDKDGHPYVDYRSTLMSWKQSRKRILDYLIAEISELLQLLSLTDQPELERLQIGVELLRQEAVALGPVSEGDAKRVKAFQKKLEKLTLLHIKVTGEKSPQLNKMALLFELFPSLVVPLEFREDSEVVAGALNDKSAAINKMFSTLSDVAKGGVAKTYVQGFVLSMVQSAQDISSGIRLMRKHLKNNANIQQQSLT